MVRVRMRISTRVNNRLNDLLSARRETHDRFIGNLLSGIIDRINADRQAMKPGNETTVVPKKRRRRKKKKQ